MSRSLYLFPVSNKKASPVSASNLTSKSESVILKAFDAIHSLNVIHGDVRPGNILVAESGNAAWIIDFEFAEIIKEEDDGRDTLISEETQVVRELLGGFKNHHDENGFHEDLKENLPRNDVPFVATER